MSGEWLYAPDGYSLRRLLNEFIFPQGISEITGVIHCGAWHGEEASQYAECGITNVWWVEANPHVIPRLRAQLEPRGHRVIEALLGDVDGEQREFHVTNEDGLSSSVLEFGTHKNFSPNMVFEEHLTLTMRTLDSLVAEHGITGVNMLVMDLQGAEGLCLRGAQQTLQQMDVVYSEVNTAEVYIDCIQIHELDTMLLGWARMKTWMVGNLGWGDAIYVRPKQPPATMIEVQSSDDGSFGVVGGSLDVMIPPPAAAPPPAPTEPSITVFVPSWNCSEWIDRCLGSLVGQTRAPDQVLVLDDASTDEGYWPLVESIVEQHGWSAVRNSENRKMPYNLWWFLRESTWAAGPDEVVVILDGDDGLPPTAIEHIANVYRDPETWITWGSYERYPPHQGWHPNPATPWPPQVVNSNSYRQHQGWVPFNHPLTFRHWLFDHLTEQDFQDESGQWFTAGYDYALFIPLTELAGPEHGRYLSEMLYLYNESNPESDAKIRAGECGRVHESVRRKAPREKLAGRVLA